jgi:hypothetical protein
VDQALEIAGRMQGSDRSRRHRLEIICADFLAWTGLHLKNEQEIWPLGMRQILVIGGVGLDQSRVELWPAATIRSGEFKRLSSLVPGLSPRRARSERPLRGEHFLRSMSHPAVR